MELSFHDLRLLEEGLVFSGEWYRQHLEVLSDAKCLSAIGAQEYMLECCKTRLAEIDALLERVKKGR